MGSFARALCVFLVTVFAAAPEASAGGTLVVKYATGVAACAETQFSQRRSFAAVSSGGSLDTLHARLGVSEIRSMFMSCAGLSARQASAAWRARLENSTARNPRRAMRAAHSLPSELPDLSRVFRLHYAADIAEEMAAALYAADPMVEYAHPDYPAELAHVPDDPYFFTANSWNSVWADDFDDLWGLKAINAPTAWDLTMGEGTVIAVVDTGVDRNHPDIADNIWSNSDEVAGNGIDDDGNGFVDDSWGWDFVTGDDSPFDGHGHGTHVAGIAAAVGDNGIGVLGVAPRAKIMSVRIFSGEEQSSGGAEAIVYAAESGADVINNSWGLRAVPGGSALDDAVDTALALGSVVVFAGDNGEFGLTLTPWWRHPGAISVSMARPPFGAFPFSASDVDIAAPGRDVLSLRGGNGMNGPTIDGSYVVGSGTSMAAPHVAGAAALLLSVLPDLTPSEVKWHLETSAVQSGRAGWEGLPWNPMSGWGLLDLTQAFDPLAVTTRLDRFTMLERHDFVGQAGERTRVEHRFTTHDSIGWSAGGAPWMQATPALGSGDGTVDLAIDAGVAGVGIHEDSYQVSALSAADGGATLPVRLYAYPDTTLADRAVVFTQDRNGLSPDFGISALTAAGSPTHSVVAWNSLQDAETQGAVLDAAGNIVDAFALSSGRTGQYVDSVFDGRRFAVLWVEYDGAKTLLLLSRLAYDGAAIDVVPREIGASSKWWREPRIAFDGSRYVILWTEDGRYTASGESRLLMLRMGADFATEKKPAILYRGEMKGPAGGGGTVELACGRGHCLAVWAGRDPAQPAVGVVRALRFVDGEPVGAPFDIAANPGFLEPQIASSGDHYLVIVGVRTAAPCGPTRSTICDKGILGVRVSPSGELLDASPKELITAPADTPMAIELGKIGFDGTHYLLPYTLWNQCTHHCESAVFATRVSVDGVVLDEDAPRSTMLVDSSRERQQTLSAVAATAGGVAVTWSGVPRDRFSGIATELSVEARALASHETDVLPPLEIGAIESISVEEREQLAVRLLAPGLSSPETIFSAQGLPAGAILDASSGVLHWTPAPHEAGIYADVRLIADDGSNHLEETLSITVSNVASSLSGTVRLSDGTPVAGVAVALQGRGYKRTTASELDGRYSFFDLVPQSYKLAVGRPSRRNWRARSVKAAVAAATEDIAGQDLVVTPR